MSHDSTHDTLSSLHVLPSRLVISVQRASAASCVEGHLGTAVLAGPRAALLVPPVHADLTDPSLTRGSFLLVIGMPDPTTDTVLRIPIARVRVGSEAGIGSGGTPPAVAEFDLPGWPTDRAKATAQPGEESGDDPQHAQSVLAEAISAAVQPDEAWLNAVNTTTRRPPRTGGEDTLYGALRAILRSPITATLTKALHPVIS